MLQCVAVCCDVLQCVAVCVAVRCSVLQCVELIVLFSIAVFGFVLFYFVCKSVLY